jgi:hypothetical protein
MPQPAATVYECTTEDPARGNRFILHDYAEVLEAKLCFSLQVASHSKIVQSLQGRSGRNTAKGTSLPQNSGHQFRASQLGTTVCQQQKKFAAFTSAELSDSQAMLQIQEGREYSSVLIQQSGSGTENFCVNVTHLASSDGKRRQVSNGLLLIPSFCCL